MWRTVIAGNSRDWNRNFQRRARSSTAIAGQVGDVLWKAKPSQATETETIPRNPFQGGTDERQHQEWIAACKGRPPAYSNFDLAAYLTEVMLLGCVAMRTGKRLEWDGPKMRARNAPEASQYVQRQYRKRGKL